MRFILLFLFSISAFAGQMTKADLESCADGRTFYMRGCQGECYDIPEGYNCKYSRVKSSKSETESCFNDEDCQSKLEAKVCSDQKEQAVKVLTEPKEVYCTKEYIGEDASLKTSYDTEESDKEALKAAKKASKEVLKGKLEADIDLTKEELREMLLHLLGE